AKSIQHEKSFSQRIPVQEIHNRGREETAVHSAFDEVAVEPRGAGRGPQTDVTPPVPSIIVACRANAALVSFSKSWIVHEFMIVNRSQSVLVVDVAFGVGEIGRSRWRYRRDIPSFVRR